jgi:acetyl-CoA acetyltransferase
LFCSTVLNRARQYSLFKKFVSGSYKGSLSSLKAHEIGSLVIKEALKRADVQPEEVTEVILGQVSLLSLTL